jgi:uncharacterized spore protein YtfJ
VDGDFVFYGVGVVAAREVMETVMNRAQEILQSLTERFATTANVKQVFGEPIEAQGKTIVPVARVWYHVGAGWGGRKSDSGEGGQSGGGGGGGGTVIASPVGVLEMTAEGVRFERFFDAKQAGILVGAGVLLGLAVRRLLTSK